MEIAKTYILPVITLIIGVIVTHIFKEWRFRRGKWHEFDERRLREFYGPMLGLIEKVKADFRRSGEISDASDQAWREICGRHPHPFVDHDKYFEPFKNSLEYENERFRNEDIPALDKMLEIFKSKSDLAYESTAKLFPQFSQYVDQFHRTLPYEVLEKLDHSAEPMARLAKDVEKHVYMLKRKLSGEKRA